MVSLLDTEIDSILRCAPVCCPNCGREDAELTDSSTRPMRLAVSQFAPRQGDIQHNIARIRGKISRSSAELQIFPELAATGYDVRDRVHELAMDAATLAQLVPSSADRAAVLGFIADYRVRGFTRNVRGMKHYIDHQIDSIQNFISAEIKDRYVMVDVNVYQENIFHTKMHLKEFDLDTYLFEEKAKNLSFKDRMKIESRLKREIEELYHGRNLAD